MTDLKSHVRNFGLCPKSDAVLHMKSQFTIFSIPPGILTLAILPALATVSKIMSICIPT